MIMWLLDKIGETSLGRMLFRFHRYMIDVWVLLTIPTILWWKDSILWVACMSIYACIGFHVEGYQAARIEAQNRGGDEDHKE